MMPTAVAKAARTLKEARMMVEVRIDFEVWKRNSLMMAEREELAFPKEKSLPPNSLPMTMPLSMPPDPSSLAKTAA
jgi:hypothetical protein